MRARVAILAAIAIALAAEALASAQPAPAPGRNVAPVADAAAKSPGVATGLAIGSTVLASGLFVGSIAYGGGEAGLYGTMLVGAVAPSAGHIYAGEGRHALITSAVRGAGLTMMLIGVGAAFDWCEHDCGEADEDDALGNTLFGVGLLTHLIATGYDLVDAHRAAKRTNVRRRSILVQPAALRSPSGTAVGISIGGRF